MKTRYGLIGRNIGQSQSPIIHQTIARLAGKDIAYDLLDVDEVMLPELIEYLYRDMYDGYNVTMPYKQKIMPFVHRLTKQASRIGAVNTIYLDQDQVIGDNTDYDGFIGLLKYHKIKVRRKKVAILGNGGAAMAVYVALKDLGAKPIVVVRSDSQVDKLFKEVVTYDDFDWSLIDIYVNATPVGSHDTVGQSLLDPSCVQHQTVIDLIYQPPVTQLMQEAERAFNGEIMLIMQALKSASIWYQKDLQANPKNVQAIKDVIKHE